MLLHRAFLVNTWFGVLGECNMGFVVGKREMKPKG